MRRRSGEAGGPLAARSGRGGRWTARLALGGGALWLLTWVAVDSRFRDAEGMPTGALMLPVAGGIACTVLACAVGTRWRWCGAWLALGLVGQAVALQMIDAGPAMRYQHYRPPGRLLAETPALVVFLGFQVALVGIAVGRRWSGLWRWLRSSLRPWQVVGVGAAVVVTSATVSRDPSAYGVELLFASFVQLVNLANAMLIGLTVPGKPWGTERLAAVLARGDEAVASRGVDRLALAAAAWVVVVSAALSILAYERHPHVPDEVAYVLQARLLASGAVTAPAPPVPEAFETYLMRVSGDRWYPVVPPGWPAVLAIGVLAGVPWLVNPVLGGANVLLAHALVHRLYGLATARQVAFLLAVSPWHLFMAMNFMTHTLTLTCALVAAVAVGRAERLGWAWLGGAAVGMATLIRPLDGLVTGAIIGVWILCRRLPLRPLVAFGLGALMLGGAVLPFNRALTGDPLAYPIMTYTDEHFGLNSNAYGFGPDRGMGWPIDPFPGHGPLDGLVNASLNSFSLNIELLGWSTGSLVLAALALCAGAKRREDWGVLGAVAAVFVAYFFYYFSGGPDFGARYWFLMIVPCLVLTARGLQWLVGTVEPLSASGVGRVRATAAVLALCFMALVNYVPWRALDKYHHYLGMRAELPRLDRRHEFGPGLVLVRGERFPDYASAVVYNPLDLASGTGPVYAWDRSAEIRQRLLDAYPGRATWVVDGPSRTRAGYAVVAGPVPARGPAQDGVR